MLKDDSTNLFNKILVLLACILAICSAKPWFSWGFDVLLYLGIVFDLCGLILLFHQTYFKSTILNILIFFVVSIPILKIGLDPINLVFRGIIKIVIPFIIILLFNLNLKKNLLVLVIKVYSIIIFVSLIGFTLFLLGLKLPYSYIENSNPYYDNFVNYYFFIEENSFHFFHRFNSIFTEPGHVGMINAILLYINGFSLKKWENITLTLGLVLSFSLAGYMLYLIGILLFLLSTSKNIKFLLFRIFCSVILLSIGIAAITYYAPQDNIFTSLILDRISFNESGEFSGNNRTTLNFDRNYTQYKNTREFYSGLSSKDFGDHFNGTPNSSVTSFIYENGILSLIFTFIFLLFYTFTYYSKQGVGLLIIIVLSFLQRPYFFWAIESFSYLCAIPFFYSKTHNEVSIRLNCVDNKREKI